MIVKVAEVHRGAGDMEISLADYGRLWFAGRCPERATVRAQIVRVGGEDCPDLSYIACAGCARGSVFRKVDYTESSSSQTPAKCNCNAGLHRRWRFDAILHDKSMEGVPYESRLKFKVWGQVGASLIDVSPVDYKQLNDESRTKVLNSETLKGIWELELRCVGQELSICRARRPAPVTVWYDASEIELTVMADEAEAIDREDAAGLIRQQLDETISEMGELSNMVEECWDRAELAAREAEEQRSSIGSIRESLEKMTEKLHKLSSVL